MIQVLRERYGAALELIRPARGLVGLGLGLRETGGRPTDAIAWRAYVRRKRPERELGRSERIPRIAAGIPVDVLTSPGRASCRAGAGRRVPLRLDRSLRPGAPIANARGVPGTLGAVVHSRLCPSPVLLASQHVLFGRKARRGDPISTATAAGSVRIGSVLAGKAGLVTDSGSQVFVDAGLGAFNEEWSAAAEDACEPESGWAAAEPGADVWKVGAASGRTRGVVVDVCYPDRWYWEYHAEDAPRQILIRSAEDAGAPFSESGDSGAVVRDERGRGVGLLWGSNARGEGVASPMGAVVRALGLLQRGGSRGGGG